MSACASMGVHLSNILSNILEPLALRLGAGYEFVSTEDMLSKIDQYNENIEDIRKFYSEKLGRDVPEDQLSDLLGYACNYQSLVFICK